MLILSSVATNEPTQRRNTISAKALVELREAILTTRIKPGDGLSETEVAQALGISRTPVREAFARLFEEGLIEISPQKGTQVSLIDMARVKEAIFIRSTLESAVIAGGNVVPPAEVFDELDILLRQQERAWEKHDMVALHRADTMFHSTIMTAFGRPLAWTAIQHVLADMVRVQFLVGLRPDHVEAIVAEHRAIVEAIKATNFAGAAELMASHIASVNVDQNELLVQNSHYFHNVEARA